MRVLAALMAAVLAPGLQAEPGLESILRRAAEESSVFADLAPRIFGTETLEQKEVRKPSRFRLRIGSDAAAPPAVRVRERKLISEYGFAKFPEDGGAIHEMRTVVSVDGRQVTTLEKARERMTLGATGPDERLRRRLLNALEQHGLKGGATDFGPLLLLLARRHHEEFEFTMLRRDFLDGAPVQVVGYRQRLGDNGVVIFEGRGAQKAPLEGELWVRAVDLLPLRITCATVLLDEKRVTEHRGTVDYEQSRFGVLLPKSVRYEKLIDQQRVVDNLATYSEYRMFGSSVEIEFRPGP